MSKVRWRLAELRLKAEKALDYVGYSGSDNGQISDVPNERALRYYTTIGLLDRPAEMRGRTAYYAWRHLLQVVAIKKLQSQGLSLVDVQQRLTGRPDDALAAMAGLPVTPVPELVQEAAEAEEDERRREGAGQRKNFWMQAESTTSTAINDIPVPSASTLINLNLSPDLMLVWNGEAPSASDHAALTAAAGPLIRELKRRGLIH